LARCHLSQRGEFSRKLIVTEETIPELIYPDVGRDKIRHGSDALDDANPLSGSLILKSFVQKGGIAGVMRDSEHYMLAVVIS
jgi:hypothetical protein